MRCAEPDDNRSLYARLKEQKDTKQEEWEHKHAFKNQARAWQPHSAHSSRARTPPRPSCRQGRTGARAAVCASQMDHWRLDEDEAGFEDDRQEKQRLQQAEAARLHAESAEFYQLARATRERKVEPVQEQRSGRAAAATLGQAPPADKDTDRDARKRRDASLSLPAFKVKVHKKAGVDVDRVGASGPVANVANAAGGLPGMEAYGDDDSD